MNHHDLRGGAEKRFGSIEQHARIYSVRLKCRVLGVSPIGDIKGYYNRQHIHPALRCLTPKQTDRNPT